MKKSRPIGVYTQLKTTKDPHRLPPNLLEIVKDAISSGVLHAPAIWRKRIQLAEEDFLEVTQNLKKLANDNAPLFHLLMTCFLKTIRKGMRKKGLERIFTQNFYVVSGMIQRELTQMCLTMHADDLESSNEWSKYIEDIEEDHEEWMKDFRGALSAARVARLFTQQGIRVYLPTVYTDIQLRIDLLACVPKKSFGLCVQVKSQPTIPRLNYHLFHDNEVHPREERLQEKDCLFIHGVAYFSNQRIGTWIPIEIKIGDAAYATDTIIPPPVMIEALKRMLHVVYTTDLTTLSTRSTPNDSSTPQNENDDE